VWSRGVTITCSRVERLMLFIEIFRWMPHPKVLWLSYVNEVPAALLLIQGELPARSAPTTGICNNNGNLV
jgi:hypothetical protein